VERRRIVAPKTTTALAEIRAFAAPLLRRVAGASADDLILALDESCSNIIKHRAEEIEGGRIEVTIEAAPGVITIRIGKFCRPSDVAQIKPRDLPAVQPGGLGTHFVKHIMDRVAYIPDAEHPGALDLVMEKQLPTATADRTKGGSKA